MREGPIFIKKSLDLLTISNWSVTRVPLCCALEYLVKLIFILDWFYYPLHNPFIAPALMFIQLFEVNREVFLWVSSVYRAIYCSLCLDLGMGRDPRDQMYLIFQYCSRKFTSIHSLFISSSFNVDIWVHLKTKKPAVISSYDDDNFIKMLSISAHILRSSLVGNIIWG